MSLTCVCSSSIFLFYNVIILSILLKDSVHSIMANSKQEFVILAVVKELLEVRVRSYKSMFEILFKELKEDVSSLHKEVTELKSSLTFRQET